MDLSQIEITTEPKQEKEHIEKRHRPQTTGEKKNE